MNVVHVLSPPHQSLLGSSLTRRNPLPSVSVWVQRDQTCGVPLFKALPTRRALKTLPIVSLDALTLLVCYVKVKVVHITPKEGMVQDVNKNLENSSIKI